MNVRELLGVCAHVFVETPGMRRGLGMRSVVVGKGNGSLGSKCCIHLTPR